MKPILLLAVLLATTSTVRAMEMHHDHHSTDTMMPQESSTMKSKMAEPMMPHQEGHHSNLKGRATPSAQAYAHVNHVMHEGMMIEFTGDADIDFLRGMIPHHQGAVDMAEVQLQYGQNGSLKHLTKRIIRDQKREIRSMKRILAGLESKSEMDHHAHHTASTKAFKKGSHQMHRAMDIRYTGNADRDFVTGMIPHHQGAVEMARIVIQYGQDPSVRRLAYDIINAQESEITWMKRWQHQQNLLRPTWRR